MSDEEDKSANVGQIILKNCSNKHVVVIIFLFLFSFVFPLSVCRHRWKAGRNESTYSVCLVQLSIDWANICTVRKRVAVALSVTGFL